MYGSFGALKLSTQSFAFCVVAACSTRPQRTTSAAQLLPQSSSPTAHDAGVATDAHSGSVTVRPRPVDEGPALARTEAALQEAIPAELAVWTPFRLIGLISTTMHDFAAPTSPRFEQEIASLSLVLPPSPIVASLAERDVVCVEARRLDERIVCVADTVELSGAERARWSFAWRVSGLNPPTDLGVAVRALSRLGDRVCVKAIELTARTMELTIQTPDRARMVESLALLASAPRMSEVFVVRFEPNASGVLAVLSWPTDRADRSVGTMGMDPWPARCDGHVGVLGDDATVVRATMVLTGTNAQGVILERASRRFIVTVGDRVGDAEITAISQASVRIRSAGTTHRRERNLPVRAPAGDTPTSPLNRQRTLLPPEPTLTAPPRFRPPS